MSCKILGWRGRVGNNLQQITNALYFSITNRRKLVCNLPHEIFYAFDIDFSDGDDTGDMSSYFYYYRNSKQVNTCDAEFLCDPDDCDRQRLSITRTYIRPLLNFDIHEIQPYDEKTLVIHMRCGDVFSADPHNCYVPNPVSFYRKVMHGFEKVIIVSEDPTNIIVKELLNDNRVSVQSSSVRNDFMTLLKAQSLCTSGVGTFSIAAALLSCNLKNLYCTSLYLDNHLNPTMLHSDSSISVSVTDINEDEYIRIGDWKCSQEQLEKIMTFQVKHA